ncbi:MAG: APC family permease, partial [Chlamydiales bacterium]
MNARKKVLGFFQVVMINVIAVDSIRNLPFSATYGFSLVFFYLLAALLFFIPGALVAAELGTAWPTTGGLYVWVREAFGKKIALLTIWLNWTYNIFWYPTIMALIAGTLTYFFNPDLANNKFYMASVVVLFFWGTTLVNCFGMKVSGYFSALAATVGTILPMVLIALLGAWWLWKGHPVETSFTWKEFFPTSWDYSNVAYLTNVLFGLIGLEMSATHAEEMQNPKRDYPRSLAISVVIVLATTIFASLAISIIVPSSQLNLVVGTMQAFATFVQKLDLPWLLPCIAACIVLGGLGGAAAWVIGPTKGLMVASKDGTLPAYLMHANKHGAPINMLIIQAVVVTLLSIGFILMPTVASSFWLFSLISAQLALVVYIFLFASAIALR